MTTIRVQFIVDTGPGLRFMDINPPFPWVLPDGAELCLSCHYVAGMKEAAERELGNWHNLILHFNEGRKIT